MLSEEEKKAIEYWKRDIALYHCNTQLASEHYAQIILNLIEKQQKELEHYKRLAEMNLKDSEEFKKNMCEHRCVLNNQIMELTEELNNLKEIEKSHQEENGKLRVKLTKQEKMIELIEKECKQRLAFAKRIRRSEKRNPDDFNQGLEFESATIMNLLSGEPHWEYEGKYFDDIDEQVEKLKAEENL